MTQIETKQITFGKQTMRLIVKLLPHAKTRVQIGKHWIIKDAEGKTIATWQKRHLKTGLIVIH